MSVFGKCDSLPKRGFWRCLSKEPMPFVKSKPPLPTRNLRPLRAVPGSTLHQLCIVVASVASCLKKIGFARFSVVTELLAAQGHVFRKSIHTDTVFRKLPYMSQSFLLPTRFKS